MLNFAQEYGLLGWVLFWFMVALAVAVMIRFGLPYSRTQMESEVRQLRSDVTSLRAALDALSEQNLVLRNRLQIVESLNQETQVTLARLRGEMGRSS